MKLHEQRTAHMNLIGRYGPGEVLINGRAHSAPLLVAPGHLRTEWISDIRGLDTEALAQVWELQPRIVLLGADARDPARIKPLRSAFAVRQIALEPMDLGAACRTYNVLAQEDRAVVALLFP
jgi:uncharacterized protein